MSRILKTNDRISRFAEKNGFCDEAADEGGEKASSGDRYAGIRDLFEGGLPER